MKYLLSRLTVYLILIAGTIACQSTPTNNPQKPHNNPTLIPETPVEPGTPETPVTPVTPINPGGGGHHSSPATTIALSGKAAVVASDLARRIVRTMVRPYGFFINEMRRHADPAFDGTNADTPLTDATVTLYKIEPDGTKTSIATTTTAEDGAYAFGAVTPAVVGTGADSNFYYQVCATQDSVTICNTVAPENSGTVNLSPETQLGSSVMELIGLGSEGTPTFVGSSTILNALSSAAATTLLHLVDNSGTFMPTAQDNDNGTDIRTAMANGLVTTGDVAQNLYQAVKFSTEYLGIMNNLDEDAATVEATEYLRRVVRAACSGVNFSYYLSKPVATELASHLLNGDTYTVSDIITAYTSAGGAMPTLDGAALGATVQANLEQTAGNMEPFSPEGRAILMTARDLDLGNLSEDTVLTVDQMLSFLQLFPNDRCALGRAGNPFIDNVISWLLHGMSLVPTVDNVISNAEIYNDSGFGCTPPDFEDKGHFRANILVYPGIKTVTAVTITSSDHTALDGTGSLELASAGSNLWVADNTADFEGKCVAIDQQATYTITVTFSDTTTLTSSETIERTHPVVPEATNIFLTVDDDGTLIETAGSTNCIDGIDLASPTSVNTTQPLNTWGEPVETLATLYTDNPGDTITYQSATDKVCFTYEFSYIDKTSGMSTPLVGCDYISSGTGCYDTNTFMPAYACDVAACATASSVAAENILCRTNIQTYFVTASGDTLAQAAGNFTCYLPDLSR